MEDCVQKGSYITEAIVMNLPLSTDRNVLLGAVVVVVGTRLRCPESYNGTHATKSNTSSWQGHLQFPYS